MKNLIESLRVVLKALALVFIGFLACISNPVEILAYMLYMTYCKCTKKDWDERYEWWVDNVVVCKEDILNLFLKK